MGCRFCASTLDGLERNLTPSEMLRQVYQIQKITGERVSNIVIMGTGEPLDNYDNFLKFIHMVSDEHGSISAREISRRLPVELYRTSGDLQKKSCRSRWHFPCTVPTRKREDR